MLMSTWTKQMGYPLITVSQKIDGKKRILKLSQKRFLADGTTDEKNSLWQVGSDCFSVNNFIM